MHPAIPADGLEQPQRTWAWLTIGLAIALAVLDGSIANVALPTIATDFNASPSFAIWVVNGYQLAIVVAILPMASLGGIYGYRRVYLGGIVLFTLASLACAFSTSLTMLTTARIVQGIGAAGLMSLNTAILRYIVPKARFGAAVGFNSLLVAAAATVGPSLAGVILSVASWPWLFAINIPLGILAVAVGFVSVPDSERAKRRFDWVSAALSAIAVGLVIVAIDSIGHAEPWPLVIAEAAGSIVAAILLYRREAAVADPLLPVDLLRLPVFSMSIVTSIASFVGQMLAFVSLPFTFQALYGFPAIQVGLLMMPWPLATAIAAPISGHLSDHHSPVLLGSAGLALFAVGLVLLGLLPAHPAFADIAWRMALCGAGFGFFQSPSNRTLVIAAPRQRSAAASGMLSMARLSGQAVGAALVALILGRLGIAGGPLALYVAAGFAAIAAFISLTRIRLFETP